MLLACENKNTIYENFTRGLLLFLLFLTEHFKTLKFTINVKHVVLFTGTGIAHL